MRKARKAFHEKEKERTTKHHAKTEKGERQKGFQSLVFLFPEPVTLTVGEGASWQLAHNQPSCPRLRDPARGSLGTGNLVFPASPPAFREPRGPGVLPPPSRPRPRAHPARNLHVAPPPPPGTPTHVTSPREPRPERTRRRAPSLAQGSRESQEWSEQRLGRGHRWREGVPGWGLSLYLSFILGNRHFSLY